MKRSILAGLGPLLLLACSTSTALPVDEGPDLASPSVKPDLSTVTSCAGAGCGFVVQEWGTYTSVEASDGHALGGVHHVDEALPTWVHSRNFTRRDRYFLEELP